VLLQVRHNLGPRMERLMPEVDPLLARHIPKRFRTVVRPVINQVVSAVEVLVVREDQPLVGRGAEVPLHPLQLV